MALSQPTTQQVADNIVAQIQTEISRTIPLLPKSFTRVLAKSLAGVFILVWKYAGFSLLQQFAAHASFRETTVNGRNIVPLIEWGRLVGVGDPNIATNSQCGIRFQVNNPDSSTLPAGTQLVHAPSGVIYITLADIVLDEAIKLGEVLAASDPDGNGGAGTIGNRSANDVLNWANPIPQLDPFGAIVSVTTVTAANAETEDAYRARVLEWFGGRPQGGAYADYRTWATSVAGIINAYPYTGDTPGTVEVYCEASEATQIDDSGTPAPSQLQAVEDAINFDSSGLATRRPIGAMVQVYSITRQAFNATINNLSPDTAEIRAVIDEALDDYLRSREPFIVGLSSLPRADRVTESAVSGVVDAAAATQGATVETVDLFRGLTPIVQWTLTHGQRAKLGDTTYVST